mmetsp:Transcript_1343/g.3793  ORF Transcript_1343/g.3793 Transcript_1343/m.3793 type:complete len:232 (+) Transcript_1343:455-1150(+)
MRSCGQPSDPRQLLPSSVRVRPCAPSPRPCSSTCRLLWPTRGLTRGDVTGPWQLAHSPPSLARARDLRSRGRSLWARRRRVRPGSSPYRRRRALPSGPGQWRASRRLRSPLLPGRQRLRPLQRARDRRATTPAEAVRTLLSRCPPAHGSPSSQTRWLTAVAIHGARHPHLAHSAACGAPVVGHGATPRFLQPRGSRAVAARWPCGARSCGAPSSSFSSWPSTWASAWPPPS